MKRLGKLALLSLLTVTACDRNKTDRASRSFVIDVTGGNTLVVASQGGQYQIRLCGVDVPSEKQAQAKKLLLTLLLPFLSEDKTVVVTGVATQSNGDRVAEVSVPAPLPDNPEAEKDLSSELLLAGLAKVSSDKCPNSEVFLSAQEDAKERKVGIWSQK